MHEILLEGGRGQDKLPGEFRRSQNWIGGTRPGNASYVPPPHDEVEPAMAALERFIHGAQTAQRLFATHRAIVRQVEEIAQERVVSV